MSGIEFSFKVTQLRHQRGLQRTYSPAEDSDRYTNGKDWKHASLRSVTEVEMKYMAELHQISRFPESISANKGVPTCPNLMDPIYKARYLNKRELKSTQTRKESK